MSSIRLSNGDDHPEAAHKHLLDAKALLSQQRADGAAYLSGYVVECALKSLLLIEVRWQPGDKIPWKIGPAGHGLCDLASNLASLATMAGAKTAKYLKTATTGLSTSAVAAWNPVMRYRPATMALADSQVWAEIAENVYLETVAEMKIDGVL